MAEILVHGLVSGFTSLDILGLYVAAYLQYKRVEGLQNWPCMDKDDNGGLANGYVTISGVRGYVNLRKSGNRFVAAPIQRTGIID